MLRRAVDLDSTFCQRHGCRRYSPVSRGASRSRNADVAAGRLAPIYNYMNELPGMEGMPVPVLRSDSIVRTLGSSASCDAGRGCPTSARLHPSSTYKGLNRGYRSERC